MLIMFFLMLLVFGVVHMSMLLTTKQFVNYAAFAAARTYMTDASALPVLMAPPVTGQRPVRVTSKVRIAAQEAMAYLDWWDGDRTRNAKRVASRRRWPYWATRRRDGLTVTYHVPFGLPFQDTEPNGVAMTSFAPTASQSPTVPECGDNARSTFGQFMPCPIGYYQRRPVLVPGPSTGR